MKTTKRSKMLLSSIAMLLVALVALGSATYAWYLVNKKVEAKAMTVNAAVPEGLLISKTNTQTASSWGTEVALADKANLSPVSLTFDKDGVASAFTAQAAKIDEYGKDTENDAVDVFGSYTTYCVVDDFYVKVTGAESAAVTIKAKLDSAVDDSFINLAIIDETDEKVIAVLNSAGTSYGAITALAGTTGNIVEAAESQSGSAIATATTASTTATQVGTPITISPETSTNTNAKHFIVVAYADGQNSNCKTLGAVTSDVSYSLEFTRP